MGTTTSTGFKQYPYGTYQGQFEMDYIAGVKTRNGHGVLQWNDGANYVGNFKRNALHGQGKMKFSNGNVFEGNFLENNPSGYGTLTTTKGEKMVGWFICKGRSDHAYADYNDPVAIYWVRVTITHEKDSIARYYDGPATMHMGSGLLVLPGMPDPHAEVYQYAQIVAPDNLGQEPIEAELATGFQSSDFKPISLEQQGKVDASAPPASVRGANNPNTSSNEANSNGGVAYGVYDPHLAPEGQKPRPKMTWWYLVDPKTYAFWR